LTSELLLKDLETVEKVLATRNIKQETINRIVLEKAKGLIEQGKWLADELAEEDLVKISELSLLSAKKIIVVINSDENDLSKPSEIVGAIRISAKMEEELASLAESEQADYLKELGIGESGLVRLSQKAYEVLGLVSFLTAGPKEVRAWTIKKGSFAPQAAGVIHTDFERGFIAADVVPFEKFVEVGGWKNSKEKGMVKTIGKNDVISDGLVVEFKFSV
jgi:hypothetical protein